MSIVFDDDDTDIDIDDYDTDSDIDDDDKDNLDGAEALHTPPLLISLIRLDCSDPAQNVTK